jgi:hypothetical protein
VWRLCWLQGVWFWQAQLLLACGGAWSVSMHAAPRLVQHGVTIAMVMLQGWWWRQILGAARSAHHRTLYGAQAGLELEIATIGLLARLVRPCVWLRDLPLQPCCVLYARGCGCYRLVQQRTGPPLIAVRGGCMGLPSTGTVSSSTTLFRGSFVLLSCSTCEGSCWSGLT